MHKQHGVGKWGGYRAGKPLSVRGSGRSPDDAHPDNLRAVARDSHRHHKTGPLPPSKPAFTPTPKVLRNIVTWEYTNPAGQRYYSRDISS